MFWYTNIIVHLYWWVGSNKDFESKIWSQIKKKKNYICAMYILWWSLVSFKERNALTFWVGDPTKIKHQVQETLKLFCFFDNFEPKDYMAHTHYTQTKTVILIFQEYKKLIHVWFAKLYYNKNDVWVNGLNGFSNWSIGYHIKVEASELTWPRADFNSKSEFDLIYEFRYITIWKWF